MSSYTSICIIYNPNSTGPSQQMAEDLARELSDNYRSIKIKLFATRRPGHGEDIAYKCAKASQSPLIISSSGDGGYNEVINGAMRAEKEGARPICAVLPAGNANDHRRTLKKQPLAEAIKQESIERIDLLMATIKDGAGQRSRYAHSYIGLGLTPVVAVELNKQSLNALKELSIVLKAFYKFRPFQISLDGNVLTLDSIIFTNIGKMAKVLQLSKRSRVSDGEFEVVTFPHMKKIKLVGKLFKASTIGLEPARSYKSYVFTVLKKMPIQLDGEIETVSAESRVTVKAVRQKLRTVR